MTEMKFVLPAWARTDSRRRGRRKEEGGRIRIRIRKNQGTGKNKEKKTVAIADVMSLPVCTSSDPTVVFPSSPLPSSFPAHSLPKSPRQWWYRRHLHCDINSCTYSPH